jgi:hypothetical protein
LATRFFAATAALVREARCAFESLGGLALSAACVSAGESTVNAPSARIVLSANVAERKAILIGTLHTLAARLRAYCYTETAEFSD